MIFSLLLAVAGVGILSALMFNAAVYALPVVVGIWTLQQAVMHDTGAVSGIALGLIAGALTYAAGHIVFETSRSRALRLGVAALFVVPAALAGYSLALALLEIGMTAGVVRQVLATGGGATVAATTLARLLASGPPAAGSTARSDLR